MNASARALRRGGCLALALLFAACQSAASRGALAAPEAKKFDADFVPPAFVSPSQTIDDIVELAETTRARPGTSSDAADEKPPLGATADDLAIFYYRRSFAAEQLGRARQRIEDLTKALHYARQTVSPIYPFLHELFSAEVEGGNDFRALAVIAQISAGDESIYVVQAAPAVRALQLARLDDIQGAQTSLEEADRAMFRSRQGTHTAADRAPFGSRRGAHTAAGRFRTLDWQVRLATAHAAILEATGRYAEAEAVWRKTLELAKATPTLVKTVDASHAAVARMLVLQDRLAEAEHHARQAVTGALTRRGLWSPHSALMLRHLALVLVEQGRFGEAQTVARLALEGYATSGTAADSLSWAAARADLARALEGQGYDDEALREYESILAALSGDRRSLDLFLSRDTGYARLILKRGSASRAVELLTGAFDRNRRLLGDGHRETALVGAALARARAASGDVAGALVGFRAAVEALAPLRVDEEVPGARPIAADARLDALGAYVGLLAGISSGRDDRQVRFDAAAEAFRVADAARGRAVQHALDANAARIASQRPALAAIIRQMQDTKRHVRTLRERFGEAAGRDAYTVAELGRQLDRDGAMLRALAARVDAEFPAYTELMAPKPVTLARARGLLRADEALITTLVTRDRTFVWAVPSSGAPAFAALPLGAGELEVAIAELRRPLEPNAKTLGDIPDFDVAAAHALYARLLEPVRPGWADARSLLVVGHGPLAQLPLGVLPTRGDAVPAERGLLFSNYREVPWLARTHAITVLPSVGSLATLRALPGGNAGRYAFVGFGDPWFSQAQTEAQIVVAAAPARDLALTTRSLPITLRSARRGFDWTQLSKLPPLPDTAAEIQAIAAATKADPGRDVFLGPRANEAAVKTADLAAYRIVAFATHGLLPGELTGLTQPALALSAPEIAGVEGDGVLTTDEILGLRLDADWIVLSACNTAGPAGAGAEAISGLGRAFFYAGARALLVSNWPVETTSARALTTTLFRQRPELTRSEALQATQRWMIDHGEHVDSATGKAVFSYAHPIFWAPFSLVGDGGGAVSAR